MIERPIFHMHNPAHYANLMMKYMVARNLKAKNPTLRLSNFEMEMWNIHHPPIVENEGDRIAVLGEEQHLDFQRLSYLISNGLFHRFNWLDYGQRMEYFPTLDECRMMFSRPDVAGQAIDDDCILCPVRAGEILGAIHPGYTVIPIDFYSEIAETTGLKPVFMGQIDDNAYIAGLKARFPNSKFIPHMGALEDFQTIRRARHIAIPVSTFAWLAAWLSHAETIVYPVFGMLNPQIFSSHDLSPVGDVRYRFYQFPRQDAVPFEKLFDAHLQIKGQWKPIDAASLVRQ